MRRERGWQIMYEKTPESTWNDAIQAKAKAIADLLIQKQADYGKGNITVFGEFGVLVRAYDKISRIQNLMKSEALPRTQESLRDSWADLAGYALIALMLIDKEFDLPLDTIILNP